MKLRNKKTGEVVVEVNKIGLVWNKYGMPANIGQYDSIAELNEEWEDYKPAEPLIEDDEIREIIRAWAKVNDAMVLKYNYDENSLNDIYRNTITFNMGLGLKDGEKYTITELCGEEEE